MGRRLTPSRYPNRTQEMQIQYNECGAAWSECLLGGPTGLKRVCRDAKWGRRKIIATDIPSGSNEDGRSKMRGKWGKRGEVNGRELGAMGAAGSGQRRSHHGPPDIQRSGNKNASQVALQPTCVLTVTWPCALTPPFQGASKMA